MCLRSQNAILYLSLRAFTRARALEIEVGLAEGK